MQIQNTCSEVKMLVRLVHTLKVDNAKKPHDLGFTTEALPCTGDHHTAAHKGSERWTGNEIMWNGTATFSEILYCDVYSRCIYVRGILQYSTYIKKNHWGTVPVSKEETNVLQNLKNVLKPSLLKKLFKQVKCSRVHEPTVSVLPLRTQPQGSAQYEGGGAQATSCHCWHPQFLNWMWWSVELCSHSLLECTWVAEMGPRQDSEQRTMTPSLLVSELKIWLPKFTHGPK